MICYILRDDKLDKLQLPAKVSGVYSILNNENKMITNIEAENDKWVIKSNDDIEIQANGQVVKDVELVSFCLYVIKEVKKELTTKIISLPTYDNNVEYYISKKDTITIGSSNDCSIVYNIPSVSSTHVTLSKSGNHWVAKTENKGAYINNKPFRNKNMFHGDYIFLYGLKIIVINNYFIINKPNNALSINPECFEKKQIDKQVITYEKEIPDDTPLYNKNQLFFKAPRFKSVIEKERVVIDTPPEREETSTDPAILQVGPRLTMVITSAYTLFNTLQSYMLGETTFERCIPSILAIVTLLLSSFFWPTITRKYHARRMKKENIRRYKKYRKYLEKKKNKIDEIKSLQKQILIENNIPLEECQSIIYNRKRNLWERNIDHDDFLEAKIGIGRVETQIDIEDPSDRFTIEDSDVLQDALDEILAEAKYMDDCPVNVSFIKKQVVAIVGNELMTKYFVDSLFLQFMTFHAYNDLKIVTITNKKNEYLWEYLKIIPHSWDGAKENRYFATTAEEAAEINTELEKVFGDRRSDDETVKLEENGEQGEERPRYFDYRPYYLIFLDDLETGRNLSAIKKILSYRTNLGFSIIIRNNRLSNLPSECTTFINVDGENSGLFESELASYNQKQFNAELNKSIDMYGCAEQLANIPMVKDKGKYELPSSVSFLSIYKVGKVEQLNSLERWKTNNPVASLAVPIGINQDGEIFKMDAHEKGWGPHGLVAGMTGSGKSEWIITYILSLAVNFHPDEVQFVLIDYKGGGLALSFENKEMGIKLPHLAGTITNLDKSAINRALTSIEAELKRRQNLFNEAREKLHESSINIYKYQQYYRKGMLDEPMSHLFIISDEFAELKSQEPEFLDQLVSTARIGRSLGVHLILATQKPSGVVNDQIWSNSRFHVCLRVQDKSDSQEMIKSPDAAMLKTTGSFYLQVGYNEYFSLGQSAWAGAKYYPSDIVKTDVDQSVQYIDNMGKTINSYDENTFKENVRKEDNGEELLNIVSYISKISEGEHIVGKQLWLPNIPEEIMLADVKKRYNHQPKPYDFTTVIGEYDNPALQEQNVFTYNLKENTAIFGETGSGKENLISTILWSSMTEHTPTEINYYIIDLGSETLRMFSKFPHVGEVAFIENFDTIIGILQMIEEEIERRKDLFADYNGSYEGYLKESGKALPLWTIVINAFDIFQENLPRLVDAVNNMFRDGVKYGITFIVSVSSQQALRSKVAAFFKNKIVLHQPDDTNYRSILGCDKKLIPQNAYSRGIAIIKDDLFCEFQGAYIAEKANINSIVRKNADNFAAYYKVRAKSLPKIPDTVTSEELSKYITTLDKFPIGYNFHEKNICTFDMLKQKMFVMCVDNFKDTINSIYGIVNMLSKSPGTKVRVLDFDNIYKGTNMEIQYFNEKLDATILALKGDLEKRTDNQDQGITFVLGVGLYKNKLKEVGTQYFVDYINAINDAKKSTIILVDTYERMKRLRIETWFKSVNTSYGIWLGNNISNQNLFSVKSITMEDRKIVYEGLGFVINDAEYMMIKTVLDGEDS